MSVLAEAVIPELFHRLQWKIWGGSAIGTLGDVAAVAVGGYVAFMVVRRGLRWLNTSLR